MHPKYNSTPMRSFTHQWNLSRIFGSQSVGCASSRSWPEAGIATRIIPAQSSRWTLHGQGDVFCRPADLPTCRPADLATWRLGESDHRGYRPSHSPPATAESFRPPSTARSRFSLTLRNARRLANFQQLLKWIIQFNPSATCVAPCWTG